MPALTGSITGGARPSIQILTTKPVAILWVCATRGGEAALPLQVACAATETTYVSAYGHRWTRLCSWNGCLLSLIVMAIATLTRPEPELSVAPGHFISVSLDLFRLQRSSTVNLYCKLAPDAEPILYRSPSIAITNHDIDVLKQRGHRALYIAADDFNDFGKQLTASLPTIVKDESIPVEERFGFLQCATAAEVTAAFSTFKCERMVSVAQRLAGHVSRLMENNTLVPRKLFDMVRHDFYTFTHIINVAGFAALLAEKLGYRDAVVKEQITIGAILHDIGKRFVPATLLCKKGTLTGREWQLIEEHPRRGYEELYGREDLSEGQLMMVYSHHERFDGKGYPVGLVGTEIHPWARLLSVVDVFDAITSDRPYRMPMKLKDGLEYIQRQAGGQFDAEMAHCWVSAMRDANGAAGFG